MAFVFFQNNNNLDVMVGDDWFPCSTDVRTHGGYYKNGFTSKIIDGKNGKHKYVSVDIYTSVGHKIAIEEKWLIRDDNKICKRLGWDFPAGSGNRTDLMKFAIPGESEADINKYIEGYKRQLRQYNIYKKN